MIFLVVTNEFLLSNEQKQFPNTKTITNTLSMHHAIVTMCGEDLLPGQRCKLPAAEDADVTAGGDHDGADVELGECDVRLFIGERLPESAAKKKGKKTPPSPPP